MPHKIEVSGYDDKFCGECCKWRFSGYAGQYMCNVYDGILGPRSPRRRCPACIADEKAQREAAPGTTPVEVVVRERETK